MIGVYYYYRVDKTDVYVIEYSVFRLYYERKQQYEKAALNHFALHNARSRTGIVLFRRRTYFR